MVKVLEDMLGETSAATFTQPTHNVTVAALQAKPAKRTLLDSHHWANFDLSLFYEDKKLCLELTEGEEQKRIGSWTFCDGERHIEHLRLDGNLSIDIAYRPAQIAVSFCESVKGLRRWIRSTDCIHWSEYQLRPDGMVAVSRPGEELVVG